MSWKDLTEREKYLDHAIDGCKMELDSSDSCAHKIAAAIDASKQEIPFIKERIALRLQSSKIMQNADDLISRTEDIMDRFSKDDEEWKRKGKALGFNFWND